MIALSLFQRFLSRENEPLGFRVLAALRNEFGGHAVATPGRENHPGSAGAGGIQAAAAAKNVVPR